MKMKKYLYRGVTFLFLCLSVWSGLLFADNQKVFASEVTIYKDFDNLSLDEVKNFYYNQLTDWEKSIYQRLKERTWDDTSIELSAAEVEDYSFEEVQRSVGRANGAVIADNPMAHAYWERYYELQTNEDGSYKVTLIRPSYVSEYSIQKAIARKDQIVATIGKVGDRYTRMRKLWNYMARCATYDEYRTDSQAFNGIKHSGYNDSVLGVLLADTAVCAGYSDLCKVLCNELDIPCIVVGNAGHAWNYIQMENGKWYAVDFSLSVDYPNYLLQGSTTEEYMTNENYFLSDMYIIGGEDFSFPILSEEAYVYTGEETDFSYVVAENSFKEWEKQFVYQMNEDGKTCTVVEYIGLQEGNLEIPSNIDGYTVTRIGNEAFYGCRGFTGDLIIPDTVEYIGELAFLACTGLSGKLQLSSNLKTIDRCAFMGCKNLKGQIKFPDSLKVLGDYAFYNCLSFEGDVSLPENIELLGMEVFFLCRGLDGTFYLPDGIEWNSGLITACSFQAIEVSENNAKYLTSDGILYSKDGKKLLYCPPTKMGNIKILDTVEIIGAKAFFECEKVVGDLILPSKLRCIEREAFRSAGFTGKLVLPDTVEEIEDLAFYDCKITGDLYLPDSIVNLGERAFLGCNNINGMLRLPNGIKK